jgi:hypothetical protein
MAMSPERKREVWSEFEDLFGPLPMPKPTLVCENGRIVGEALVMVSTLDPNYFRRNKERDIFVRRDHVRRV